MNYFFKQGLIKDLSTFKIQNIDKVQNIFKLPDPLLIEERDCNFDYESFRE